MKQGAGVPREPGSQDRLKIGHGQGWPPASGTLGPRTRARLRKPAPGLAAQHLSAPGRDRGRADGGTRPRP